VIRGKKVMVSAQADYDQYHQQHAAQYQAYVTDDAKGAELGPDMEVAEGVTKAIGDPELLEAMGLGERPSPEAITALGAGRHGVTGEQLVAPRAGYDRVAYNDLVYSAPKSVSVEFAAARAAGDYVRAAQLVETSRRRCGSAWTPSASSCRWLAGGSTRRCPCTPSLPL